MIASCLLFSASALTIMTRTVCPRSEGASLPRIRMRILPSLSSFMPNGGAAQPMSIGSDVPIKVSGAGERGQQDAHGRAARKRAHDPGHADTGAEVGAAGDDGLH